MSDTPDFMGGVPVVGETFVNGKDRGTARALLDACDRLGVTRQVVRSARGGFIVPDEVWDAVRQDQAADALAGI